MMKLVHLPEDLVYDILSKLPAKSVVRFMCVSKTWNSMIQNPYFTQLRRDHNLFLVVCHKVDFSLPTITNKFQPSIFVGHIPSSHEDQGSLEINNSTHILSMPKVSCFDVHYVNGLICSYSKLYNPKNAIHIHICNPTTRQVVTLPRDNNLDFYPKFHLLTNFGYDPLGDNYKVLSVILTETNLFQELRILTVGDDYVWRNVGHAIPFDLMSNIVQDQVRRIGTCVNGAIHWLDLIRNVILVFDLRIEQFREIPIPDELFHIIPSTRITLFSGYLSLVNHYYYVGMDISILKDYKNDVWINHERILLNEEEEEEEEDSILTYGRLLPLCKTHTQEEIILLSSCMDTDSNQLQVCYYDTKRRSSRRFFAVKGPPPCYCSECYFGESHHWSIHDSRSLFVYQENFKLF